MAQCDCESDGYFEGMRIRGAACLGHQRAGTDDEQGVFCAEIRAGMKRRLAKMLAAEWRPA